MFEEDHPDRVPHLYRDLLVLHVGVIEDHVGNGSPRWEFGHWWPIGSIAHVFVAGSACVDDLGQQRTQAENKSNSHQMLQG
jgi:hypothetical protein